jgi:hypothetical protein
MTTLGTLTTLLKKVRWIVGVGYHAAKSEERETMKNNNQEANASVGGLK